jgi:hypothetical protein
MLLREMLEGQTFREDDSDLVATPASLTTQERKDVWESVGPSVQITQAVRRIVSPHAGHLRRSSYLSG